MELETGYFDDLYTPQRDLALLVDRIVRALTLGFAGLFLLTAAVSTWAAYDRAAAYGQFLLMAMSVLVCFAVAWYALPAETVLGILGLICAIAAAAIATGVVLLQPTNAGVQGGSLAILLPLGASALLWGGSRQARTVTAASGLALVAGCVGLVASDERSAVAALAAACVIATVLYWATDAGTPVWLRGVLWASLLLGSLAVMTVYLAAIFSPSFGAVIARYLPVSVADRFQVWRDALPLIDDYHYTGSGLASTELVYSSYVALTHVPFLRHVHNLFVQIGIEQGVVGVIAFVGMLLASGWGVLITLVRGNATARLYCTVTLAALAVLVIHGLFDAEVYASHYVVVLFAPFGFAWVLQQMGSIDETRFGPVAPLWRPYGQLAVIAAVLLPVGVTAFLFVLPGAKAAMRVNLAAVEQTRIELITYTRPGWSFQDQVRRAKAAELEPALSLYRLSLSEDPANVAASRRLGQVELSLGQYDSAFTHLSTAYRLAPEQRVNRQLLGELYALRNDDRTAAQLWSTIDTGQMQLDLRLWWYQAIDDQERADKLSQAMRLRQELVGGQ